MQLEPGGTRIALVGHVIEWARSSFGGGHSYAFEPREKRVFVPVEKALGDDILCSVDYSKQ